MSASVLTELFTASLTELLLASFFWDLLQKQNKSAETLNTLSEAVKTYLFTLQRWRQVCSAWDRFPVQI